MSYKLMFHKRKISHYPRNREIEEKHVIKSPGKALFKRHKLTRVRPRLKLTRVSFYRENTANPDLTWVKSNPPPNLGSGLNLG